MSVELDERLLDDPDALAAADMAGMLRTIAGSGAQVREASTLVAEADVESLADERPRAVVLSAVGSSAVKLTGYEIATRLAFAVWDSTPDARLLKAAEAGELNTTEGVKAQLTWMVQDQKGKTLLTRFFEEWLHSADINNLAKKKTSEFLLSNFSEHQCPYCKPWAIA